MRKSLGLILVFILFLSTVTSITAVAGTNLEELKGLKILPDTFTASAKNEAVKRDEFAQIAAMIIENTAKEANDTAFSDVKQDNVYS